MHIENVMNTDMLTVDSEATLREAAQRMSERNTGAALVVGLTGGTQPGVSRRGTCSTPSRRARIRTDSAWPTAQRRT